MLDFNEIVYADSLREFIKELEASGETSAAQRLKGWLAWKTVKFYPDDDGNLLVQPKGGDRNEY